ncbi:MAG: hypothetical protein AVDCRST_MAG79-1815, partial [uncultured Thermoleophilia bacterium]
MSADVDAVAIVTGAGRGIGRVVAERLSARGYRLGLCSRGAEVRAVAATLGEHRTMADQVDVSRPDELRRFVDGVAARFGRLDVLVNNAGINRGATLLDALPADLDAMLATNVRGPFVAMQAAARHMAACGGGRIVNVASWVGRSPAPGFLGYAASKAALLSLTRGAAVELAPLGITVNAVCPGNVWTDIWQTATASVRADRDVSVRALYEEAVSSQPLARAVEPDEGADAVLYFCGAGARSVT